MDTYKILTGLAVLVVGIGGGYSARQYYQGVRSNSDSQTGSSVNMVQEVDVSKPEEQEVAPESKDANKKDEPESVPPKPVMLQKKPRRRLL